MLRWPCALFVLAVACGGDPSSDDELPIPDFGVVSGPDGAIGVCCPVGVPSCSCPAPGGWAPSRSACPTSGACDYSRVTYGVDEWGCQILEFGGPSCLDLLDAGVPPVLVGEACTPERGCRTAAAACLVDEPGEGDLGGPGDPILNHPDGEDTVVERTLFPDGWCSTSYPGETDRTCDPEEPEGICSFGVCAELAIGPVCAEACDPTAAANDICRDGYQCHPEHAGCIPGCQSDDHCRIARQETNGVDGLQTPEDCSDSPIACTPADCADADPADPGACADPATNFDRLVYDTESSAVCDPESFRCVD